MINKFARNWKATKRPTEQAKAVSKWLNKLAEKEKEKEKNGGKDE